MATQSVSVLAAQLAGTTRGSDGLLFVALDHVAWRGHALRLDHLTDLFTGTRSFLQAVGPRPAVLDQHGSAMAISTLAGATLLLAGKENGSLIRDLFPFIKGATLLFGPRPPGGYRCLSSLGSGGT